MDYTKSNSFDTDVDKGFRFHEDGKAVPTVWSGDDANSIIWSLMALLEEAGLEGVQFDRANPASYTRVRDAIKVMISNHVVGTGRVVLSAAGVHTFVVPDVLRTGKKRLRVRGVAGGGSGASSAGSANCSGGSAGGGFDVWVDLVGVESVACTVGAGGVPASAGAAGYAGGATSFGAYVSATGGSGGLTNGNVPLGGKGISSLANALLFDGGSASASVMAPAGGTPLGGLGGNSILGFGGGISTSGLKSVGFGAGSGGTTQAATASQAGGIGILILEW